MHNPFTTSNPLLVSAKPVFTRDRSSKDKQMTRLNPFKRQHLILGAPSKSKSLNTRSVNMSTYKQNSVCSNIKQKYDHTRQLNYGRFKSVLSENVSQRFLRDKQKSVQMKRVALFGPQILKYQPAEINNVDYFRQDKALINSKVRGFKCVFSLSASLYHQRNQIQTEIRIKQQQNDENTSHRASMKNSKLKMKKTLSWNTELENKKYISEKEMNSSRSIPGNSSNQSKNFTFAKINLSSSSSSCQMPNIKASVQRLSNDYIIQHRSSFKKEGNSSLISDDMMGTNHQWIERSNMKHSSDAFQNISNLQYFNSKLKESNNLLRTNKERNNNSSLNQIQYLGKTYGLLNVRQF